MLKIAICDDEPAFTGQLENILLEIESEFAGGFAISVFLSGERLLESLSCGEYYNILYLDIEMGEVDGIMAGHHIRWKLCNLDTAIFYVTSYTHYQEQLCSNRPLGYIRKPPTVEDIRNSIIRAQRERQILHPTFTYEKSGQYVEVTRSQIYYFESQGRNMVLYGEGLSTDCPPSFPMNMKQLLVKLNDPDFMQIHRSYVANLAKPVNFKDSWRMKPYSLDDLFKKNPAFIYAGFLLYNIVLCSVKGRREIVTAKLLAAICVSVVLAVAYITGFSIGTGDFSRFDARARCLNALQNTSFNITAFGAAAFGAVWLILSLWDDCPSFPCGALFVLCTVCLTGVRVRHANVLMLWKTESITSTLLIRWHSGWYTGSSHLF